MDQNQLGKSGRGAKALFWYLTLFFSLGITATSTSALWFQFINKWFPQEVVGGFVQRSFSQGAVKFALASIIVATPLFYLFSWIIRRALKEQTLDPKNKIKVWITYVILFLTLAIAVGDLITTVFRVLDGDFTVRFILKSLTILVVVGWIFTYYALELHSETALKNSNLPKGMGWGALAIIVISFVGAFFIVDSPATARAKAYDQTRANNLWEITNAVNTYYQNFDALPETLEDLTPLYGGLPKTDPRTGEAYEYRTTDEKKFELCARFETATDPEAQERFSEPFNRFTHTPGRNCFTQEIDMIEDRATFPKPVIIPQD